MDFFSLQNIHNAEETYDIKLWKELALRTAYQGFWLTEEDGDAWYNAGAGAVRRANGIDADPYVGSEVDITLKYPVHPRWNLEAGYSHFFAGDYVSDTGPSKDADFVYLQSKGSF